jgi:hypothetical protein
MSIGTLLAHLQELEAGLADRLRSAAERHSEDHDVFHQCHTFAATVGERLQKLEPLTRRYEGSALWQSGVGEGSSDLLVDLRMLNLASHECSLTWTMAVQAAKAARDQALLTVANEAQAELELQAKWFTTRIKTAAPQALVV